MNYIRFSQYEHNIFFSAILVSTNTVSEFAICDIPRSTTLRSTLTYHQFFSSPVGTVADPSFNVKQQQYCCCRCCYNYYYCYATVPYWDFPAWTGEQAGLAVDDDAFRRSGDDTMLAAGSALPLFVAGDTALLTASFSRLPAMSEQKLASDEHEATQSSLLAVDAFVRLLFTNDSTS